ncbi:hypothetical protein BDQ17DRAFT_1295839 [Cyathus striatus]|nr:hypothetical protein BDQ17DRAFT_1295839 [Cyathus striatus]
MLPQLRAAARCCPSTVLAASSLRRIHVTTPRNNLVAPPDPVSNLRPIIYDDAPPPSPPVLLRHPYSLSEFSHSDHPASDYEIQYKLQRQHLDAFHQNFWLDSNTRFEAAKTAILDSLPSTATARDIEDAMSTFYQQWVMLEKPRTDAYTNEWRRRNWALIHLAVRVKYQKLTSASLFVSKPSRS